MEQKIEEKQVALNARKHPSTHDSKRSDSDEREWQYALSILKDKPDGSKLPYSAVLNEKTNLLTARNKHASLFNNKTYVTTHSFIKINDEIYRLALGKNSDAIIGQGTSGKVKYIEDQNSTISVVKIEAHNYIIQLSEYDILKDLQLSNGKSERRDKTKFYTHMHNLGLPLPSLLLHHDLIICTRKPYNAELKENIVYIYLNEDQLECVFQNWQWEIQEKKLLRQDLGDNYELLYDQIKTAFNGKKNVFRVEPISNELLKTNIYSATEFNQNPPENYKRLNIAINICLKVADLHEGLSSTSGTAYAHLDLKTDNIVIDEKSNIHLIDFGFSEPHINEIRKVPKELTQILGTPLYLPHTPMHPEGLTLQQYDLVALKRVLFMPLSLYSYEGYTQTNLRFQNECSVLTQNILDDLKLTPYVSTYSTKEEKNDFATDKMTARTLAGILIAAKLNLDIRYETLKNDDDLCKKITSIYSEQKNHLLERELHEEISKFIAPQFIGVEREVVRTKSTVLAAYGIFSNTTNNNKQISQDSISYRF